MKYFSSIILIMNRIVLILTFQSTNLDQFNYIETVVTTTKVQAYLLESKTTYVFQKIYQFRKLANFFLEQWNLKILSNCLLTKHYLLIL